MHALLPAGTRLLADVTGAVRYVRTELVPRRHAAERVDRTHGLAAINVFTAERAVGAAAVAEAAECHRIPCSSFAPRPSDSQP